MGACSHYERIEFKLALYLPLGYGIVVVQGGSIFEGWSDRGWHRSMGKDMNTLEDRVVCSKSELYFR